MKKEKTGKHDKTKTSARKNAEVLSELDEPRWSVISFEKRVGKNLKYSEAHALLEKLTAEKVSGLCLITDEAAERMAGE